MENFRHFLRLAAAVALALSALACGKPGASRPELANGRCTCDTGALCLQAAGAPLASAVCAPAATAGLGCASFTNATRSCWGSPMTAGLCLCSGDSTLASAK